MTMEPNESDEIRDLELKQFATGKKLEQIEDHMHSIERTHTLDVEDEWESTKDKSLSNATKRTIEVERRLALDEAYPTLRAERKEFSDHILLMRIDIDYLKRKHQRYALDIIGRMSVLVTMTGATE